MDYLRIVNKLNPLDSDYIPENLIKYNEYNGEKLLPVETLCEGETLNAFFQMQEDAKKDGVFLIIDSAYRSYEYQQTVLDYYIEKYGSEKAYEIVALPGTSEHQTGLAIDFALNRNGNYTDEFEDEDKEMVWLRNNAYKYGFILRYPKDSIDITGYNYEFWHYRFIGVENSLDMHNLGINTLEEYNELRLGRNNE